MRPHALATLALVMLTGCPADPNVAAVYTDTDAGVVDVGDAGPGDVVDGDTGEDTGEDAGAPPEADGADEPEPPPPPPLHVLETACELELGGSDCPWTQSADLLCSPELTCSIRCDVLAPCVPPAGTPAGQLADAWRECARKDAESPRYEQTEELQAACAALGGVCGGMREYRSIRSWCVLQ